MCLMSRRGWGWWQQLQSGEYRKTPSLKTSSPYCETLPPLPKHRFNTESRTLVNANNQLRSSLHNAIKKPQIKEPEITITKIQKMINEGYEANKLHELLSSALNKLKEIYKTNKSVFSNNDIVFLKNASNINNSLIMLIKTKDKLVHQIIQFRKQYPKY
jgi:hypothetical protein